MVMGEIIFIMRKYYTNLYFFGFGLNYWYGDVLEHVIVRIIVLKWQATQKALDTP